MFMAVGTATTISPPKEKMGFDDDEERREAEDEVQVRSGSDQWDGDKLNRQVSEASFYGTDDDDNKDQEDEDEGGKKSIGLKPNLGPLCTLKEHLEKDKDDESLRRWKEQLLGSVDFNSVGESLEPEVRILSLSVTSPGRPELVLPMPLSPDHSSGPLFVLKEGSRYSLKFSFLVSNNIVSGLKYTNTVWKTGLKGFSGPFEVEVDYVGRLSSGLYNFILPSTSHALSVARAIFGI